VEAPAGEGDTPGWLRLCHEDRRGALHLANMFDAGKVLASWDAAAAAAAAGQGSQELNELLLLADQFQEQVPLTFQACMQRTQHALADGQPPAWELLLASAQQLSADSRAALLDSPAAAAGAAVLDGPTLCRLLAALGEVFRGTVVPQCFSACVQCAARELLLGEPAMAQRAPELALSFGTVFWESIASAGEELRARRHDLEGQLKQLEVELKREKQLSRGLHFTVQQLKEEVQQLKAAVKGREAALAQQRRSHGNDKKHLKRQNENLARENQELKAKAARLGASFVVACWNNAVRAILADSFWCLFCLC
jgi:hypothetical protein